MFKKITRTAAIGLISACALLNTAFASSSEVIEVATFKLKEGVSVNEFKILDSALKRDYIAKQPGYISRESGYDNQEWLVIVHWRSSKDAEASMQSFMTAAPAQPFMSKLDAATMSRKRYRITK